MQWTEVLLDPTSIRLRAGAHDAIAAFALLLDGRLGEYARAARDAGWPELGANVIDGSDPGLRLLAALGRQLAGQVDTFSEFASLAKDRSVPADLATAAAVLGGIAAADAGRTTMAVGIIERRLSEAETLLERVVLTTHLVLRHRELGLLQEAIAHNEEAVRIGRRLRAPQRLAQGLRAIAIRNRVELAWQLGDASRVRTRLPQAALLDDLELRAASGLDAFLDNQFKESVEDPTTLSFSFRTEDPIESPLIGALLRAECLGSWGLIRASRQRLGRYQLMVSLGDPTRAPDPAFHLLRRASDTDGLKRAARLYRFEGPLQPLRAVGEAVVQSPWVPAELSANLVVLGEAADTIRPQLAHAAAIRLMEGSSEFLGLIGSRRTESDFMSALGRLVDVSELPEYDSVSKWLRALASDEPSGILLQPAAGAVARLPWRRLSESERAAWVEFAADHLGTPTDQRFVANSATIGLVDIGESAMVDAIISAFVARPALDVAALLLLAPRALPPRIDGRIGAMARDAMKGIRDRAAGGSYSLGGIVDPARMLATLLVQRRVRSGWRELVGFVTDPRVGASDKSTTLGFLAHHAEAIPRSQARRLADLWPVATPELPFEAPHELTGAAFRLVVAIGALSDNDALGGLLQFASATDRRLRHQAAMSLRFVSSREGIRTNVIGTALSLTEDRSPEVRGVAGQALLELASSAPPQVGILVQDRVRSLLLDAGAVVPVLTLRGLARSDQAELPLVEVARQVGRESLSSDVRDAAKEFLASVDH